MAQASYQWSDDRAQRYKEVRDAILAVVAGEPSHTARYATAVSFLNQAFSPRFFWTGFYVVDTDKPTELVVGPYNGTLGCLRIPFGRGVCGTVAKEQKTLIVPDVEAFPGHIACDSASKSEIVIPVFGADGRLTAVLDVDSDQPDAFDALDQDGLEAICKGLLTV